MKKTKPDNHSFWRERILRQLDEVFARNDFQNDCKLVKANKVSIVELLDTYRIEHRAIGYVEHYIKTGKKEELLLLSPVDVISEVDKTLEPSLIPKFQYTHLKALGHFDPVKHPRLLLDISSTATRQEVETAIEELWPKVIKQKQALLRASPKKPFRLSPNQKMNNAIYKLHDSGGKPIQIAHKLNLSLEAIKNALSRRRRLK